ncbi:MAG: M20/M25/M40 family metallo-hydrolase [Acidobacteria bacterium]|nr:MAG: M20/M25/M40 family metallo-hydrolase [Acidobacteriota bacterium]
MKRESGYLAICCLAISCVGLSPLVAAQSEPVDAAANAKIRDEGLNRSKVAQPFDMFVTTIGPRLTGSPSHRRAAEWARDTLTTWGLSNARLESWEFGRGWELEKLTLEMIEPRYMPLLGYAEAWTPSTAGEVVLNAVSTAGQTPEQVAEMADRIKGAALLAQPVVTAFIDKDREQPELVPGARIGAPPAPRQGGAGGNTGPNAGRGTGPAGRGTATGASPTAGAALLVKPSRGLHGTVFVQAGRETPAATQPAVVLAAEHYNIIARLLAAGTPVKLRVNVKTKFYETDRNSYNVIAEIPGSDPVLKNEVVLIGGHLDSWHTATGATDNADGAAAVMEALRIIKASGLQPKRTIRVALWSGEEEGLYGSKHYVTDHLEGAAHAAEREKVSAYFNIDPGTGPIYGWYCEENAAAKSIFDAWLAPFKDLGARQNILPGIGNTDHLSFKAVGIPGFTPIQDYTNYDVRLHHTNVDTAEYVRIDDLKQNAIVLASFAYHAAQRAERIPR